MRVNALRAQITAKTACFRFGERIQSIERVGRRRIRNRRITA
jgi:hypothetical protein